jgi:hypothetical protein
MRTAIFQPILKSQPKINVGWVEARNPANSCISRVTQHLIIPDQHDYLILLDYLLPNHSCKHHPVHSDENWNISNLLALPLIHAWLFRYHGEKCSKCYIWAQALRPYSGTN